MVETIRPRPTCECFGFGVVARVRACIIRSWIRLQVKNCTLLRDIQETPPSRFLSIPAELCGLGNPVHYEGEGVVKEKEDDW